MKTKEAVSTILLVVFASSYFIDWVKSKVDPPVKQCFYQHTLKTGDVVSKWVDCDTIESLKEEDNK